MALLKTEGWRVKHHQTSEEYRREYYGKHYIFGCSTTIQLSQTNHCEYHQPHGDAIDTLAFSWIVYAFTGEGMWAAIVFGVNKIPSVVFLPFAGALVEKREKKRTMITDVSWLPSLFWL